MGAELGVHEGESLHREAWNPAAPVERAIHPRPREEITAETPIRTRSGQHITRAKDVPGVTGAFVYKDFVKEK